jgi:hypothetical protein
MLHPICKKGWNFSSSSQKQTAKSALDSGKISAHYLLPFWSYSNSTHGHLSLKWILVSFSCCRTYVIFFE